MFKRFLSAVIALTLVMGMCSCSDSSQSEPNPSAPNSSYSQPDKPDAPDEPVPSANGGKVIELTADKTFTPSDTNKTSDEKFVSGINAFSTNLFKTTVKSDLADGKNTLVSPSSAAFALGMTANGADGNTLKQMLDVMGGGVDMDTFNSNMNLWISRAHENNTDKSRLSIANSVWVKDKDNLTTTEQFAKSCKEVYNAEMFKAPFDMGTVKKVNDWVSEKTDKMIPSLIEHFNGDEIMCLINCIAFDSEWDKQYSDTQVKQDQKFTNANGDEVKCTMLSSTEKCYVANDRATGFVKDYKGGKYAFMAVLPDKDTDIADYVSSMSETELCDLYAKRTNEYDVYTKLPQFTFDYGTELQDYLSQMGMTDAFTGGADFSKMFENTQAAISKVIHKTHIELSAKGTKAAAATAVIMKEATAELKDEKPKTVYLDRSFLFAIMDTELGVPVFIGTVCDPTVQ